MGGAGATNLLPLWGKAHDCVNCIAIVTLPIAYCQFTIDDSPFTI